MPASIFSETELARLASFPEEIPGDDLIRPIHADGCRPRPRRHPGGAANRLRLALQLCALRYLGFVPRNLSAAPRSAACFVADQLEVSPDEIQSYARREQTRFTALHRGSGTPRLLDAPVTGLGRTRSSAGSNGPLSTMLRRFSFASLVSGCAPRGEPSSTVCSRPRPRTAGRPSSGSGRVLLARALGSIKSEVAKLAFLRQLGAHEWGLSDLNPNRRKFLAQVGRRSTSQTLQRMSDRRRYPILVVLLHETTLDLVDEIVDLFNRALQKTDSRSRRELEAWRVATAQASNEKVRLFSRLGRLVLDPDIPDEQLRRRIFEEVANSSRPRSRKPSSFSVRETAPISTSSRTAMAPSGNSLHLVLRVLDFKSLKTDDPLIDAVEILRELNRKRRRRVPEDAGLEFASAVLSLSC